MTWGKNYDLDITRLDNAIAGLNGQVEDIRKYVIGKLKDYENTLNAMKKEIEELKEYVDKLKFEKFEKPYAILESKIERFEKLLNSYEKMLENKTITKIEMNSYHLTKAQEMLLNYCNEPRSFSEMEKYMKEHNLTMGMNFQKLKDLGLIRKEKDKWIKVKELTKHP